MLLGLLDNLKKGSDTQRCDLSLIDGTLRSNYVSRTRSNTRKVVVGCSNYK